MGDILEEERLMALAIARPDVDRDIALAHIREEPKPEPRPKTRFDLINE